MVRRRERERERERGGGGERKREREREIIFFTSALNRTEASDSDIQSVCNTLVESLFSVFVTAGELINTYRIQLINSLLWLVHACTYTV